MSTEQINEVDALTIEKVEQQLQIARLQVELSQHAFQVAAMNLEAAKQQLATKYKLRDGDTIDVPSRTITRLTRTAESAKKTDQPEKAPTSSATA